MKPALSICVPSRNRQRHFQQTIRDLLRHERTDVEFVFADNSDDVSVMNDFMTGIKDERVRYLPGTGSLLPMEDNWERVMEAATGRWVSIIGDDDYIDPDVVDILSRIERETPETDSVGWSRLMYKWPDFRPMPGNFMIQLGNRAAPFPRPLLIERMFRWEGASNVPANPFTVYHGAVSRRAVDAIKARYGRHFEHPVVDYEYACKLAFAARQFVYVEWPASVFGTCSSSNSAAVNRFEQSLKNSEILLAEGGRGAEESDWMAGFPFRSTIGVSGSIMGAQHWFKTRYGLNIDGWEENFVKALARDCEHAETREGFDLQVAVCRQALALWKDGRYLPLFNPAYLPRMTAGIYTGMRGNNLYVDETIGGATSPGAMHDIVRAMIGGPTDINYMLSAAGQSHSISDAA